MNTIRSCFILQKIFKIPQKSIYLKLIKYNKKLMNRLNITIKDYKEINRIIIDVNLSQSFDERNYFINTKNTEKSFYHFYCEKKEIKNNFITNTTKRKKISIIINKKINSLKALFKNCKNINEITFKKFNQGNILDMSEMFFGCDSLSKLDVEKMITHKVQDMSNMFDGCSLLTELNLQNFNTSNVNDMKYMFYRCSKLEKLDISNFNTSKVTNIRNMFNECSSLLELNLSNFLTSRIKDMTGAFCECKSLKKIIGINNFVTNNVKEMNYMFYGCSSLKSLSGMKFIITKNTSVKHMFLECDKDLIYKIKKNNKDFSNEAFI